MFDTYPILYSCGPGLLNPVLSLINNGQVSVKLVQSHTAGTVEVKYVVHILTEIKFDTNPIIFIKNELLACCIKCLV